VGDSEVMKKRLEDRELRLEGLRVARAEARAMRRVVSSLKTARGQRREAGGTATVYGMNGVWGGLA
jgi:hypothetical protein